MKLPDIDNLSHAIIITGNRQNNLQLFKDYLHTQEFQLQANPDLYIFNEDQVLIADAVKMVVSLLVQKVSSARFLVISCDRMAPDVQNTLLKTIEEPQLGTYIIFIVPNSDQLLPTIRSRAQLIEGNRDLAITRLDTVEFLKAALSDRFVYIESWTKNKKDEENVSKTEILGFIDHLEKKLWDIGNKDESLYSDIRTTKKYVKNRGSSHRVILDYLAMICPKL
jgi:DNA polymerase III delta prime subunit